MTLTAGMKLDNYEVIGLLGAGGMGEVYRARDPFLNREVAIKILPTFVSQDPDRLRRFEQEAQAAAALNHPNILAVHQFGIVEGAPYLVSELLEGATLRQLLQRDSMPARKAIDYGVQIARGLAAAHEKGIVHRDLKPENLFVTKDGRIKILDFGLAKLMQHRPEPDGPAPTMTATITKRTDPGLVLGTVGYMSPEQVRGETVDHRTDIFAFGAILYEMLTDKRAFQRSTSAETMAAILNDDPPGISQIVPTTPPGLQRVVHRCLEKIPEQRFHSASDLAFALEALSDSGSGPVVATSPVSSSRWLWATVAGAVVTLGALLIAWWRIPSAVPVVESVTQLTDDGQPKGNMVSDGSRIYFEEGRPENWGIAQVSVTGGATAPVKTPFTNSYIAGIKPDGSALLALVPSNIFSGEGPLWWIPLPAGEPRRLGNFETPDAHMVPDGRIVFAKFAQGADANGAGGRMDWFIADKDGSNPRELVSLRGNEGDVWVAPHGQRILLSEDRDGVRRLLDLAVDGTGLREIRKLNPDECCFISTPDEKYLVYSSGNAQQSDIWLLPMQTGLFRGKGRPVRLTNGPLPYTSPLPSRDGKQIFALGTKQRGELVRYDLKSHQFLPFLSGISAIYPTFSKDGKWVAYVSYPDHTLWRSRIDGTERMQLTFPPMQTRFPNISPDGTRIAFSSNDPIFVIDINGGQPQKIVERGSAANWSPDGNLLLLSVHAQNSAFLQIVDMRTQKTSIVPFSQGTIGGIWVTQDKLVAATKDLKKFMTFDFKTQKWADLTTGNFVNWAVSTDGRFLYASTGGAEPKTLRIRFDNHQVETIASLKDSRLVVDSINVTTWINVAPDGSPILTRDAGYQEIYALNIKWP